MRRVALAMSLVAAVETAPMRTTGPAIPKRLAIYYGYPSLVEQSQGDVARAAAVFGDYDVLVFGDGLELENSDATDAGLRAERRRIGPLIRAIHATARRPTVYGYIPLGSTESLTLAEINRRVEAWRRLGADGVFFDEAGKDFGVDVERRGAAVCRVHARGLAVFMNAFNPDDLFDAGGRSGCDSALGPRDALLVESFAIRNGEAEPASRIDARADAALRWRERTGVRVFAVTTTDGRPFDREAFMSAWEHAATRRLDGFGWGEPNFSADSRLPWRERP